MKARRQVTLRVHRVRSAAGRNLPANTLQAYFALYGVQLRVLPGKQFKEEPADWSGYLDLYQRLGPTPGRPGQTAHVILGGRWEDEGASTLNGLMLSRDRGAVAIFLQSDEMKAARRAGAAKALAALAETTAHELCHLFNISHPGPSATLQTADCESWRRKGADVQAMWNELGEKRPAGSPLLPLSGAAAYHLRNSPLDQVLPWGEPFAAAFGPDRQDRSTKG